MVMVKQVPIGKILLVIDKSFSLLQVSKQLEERAKQAKLLFVEQQTGAGYYQWTFEDDDWKPFSDFDNVTKSIIAPIFEQRCQQLREALNSSPLCEAVLTVPSESEFVYFRQKDGDWEIALTAWGYRFAKIVAGTRIGTWMQQKEEQEVNIGFLWNGKLLSDMPFFLEEMSRVTSPEGVFHIEPIEVGRKLALRLADQREFVLVVEKGRSEYQYDITKYQKVAIKVVKDGKAVSGQNCDIAFNGSEYHIQTDERGECFTEVPLLCKPDGTVADPQPECVATCQLEIQSKNPTANGDTLQFYFDFNVPVVEPKPQMEPEPATEVFPATKEVRFQLLDYGGYPMPNLPFKLTTKKMGEKDLMTDENGYCLVPQEWLTPNEKLRVNINISPEYQETHELHRKKRKHSVTYEI